MEFSPCTISATIAVVGLLIAGVMDVLFREIDPELWPPFLILSIPTGLSCTLENYDPSIVKIFYIFGLAFVGIVGLIYLAGAIGGADLFSLLLVFISMPTPLEGGLGLPPVIVVSLIAAVLSLVYRVITISRATSLSDSLKMSVKVSKEDLLRDKRFAWWIPRGVNIEDEWAIAILDIEEDKVEASPGSPFIALLFISTLIYLALEMLGLFPW